MYNIMYIITQEQYDNFITKMNNNQSGSCFILLGRNRKLLHREGDRLFWTSGGKKSRCYLDVKP